MRITTAHFRQFVLKKHPNLDQDKPMWGLYNYLAFTEFTDHDTNQIIISRRILKRIASKNKKQYSNQYNKFIAELMLEDYNLKVSKKFIWDDQHENKFGYKSRQVINSGFDEEEQKEINKEILNTSNENLVLWATGYSCSHHNSIPNDNKEVQKEREEYIKTLNLKEPQKELFNVLLNVSRNAISQKINLNKELVEQTINKLDIKKQEREIKIVKAIKENPVPFYIPSEEENTIRLFGSEDSLLNLKSEVRKVICKGWYEIDLQSSQFCILAKLLNATKCQEFINSGKSLWLEFNQFLFNTNEIKPEIKKAMKEFLYSVAFGMGRKELKKRAIKNGIEKLITHVLIVELLDLRAKWYKEIEKNGGSADCFGEFQKLDWNWAEFIKNKNKYKGRGSNKIGATIVQAIEFKIMVSILPAFNDQTRAKLILWQHDGATISIPANTVERTIKQLNKCIAGAASQFDINTKLEIKKL